MQKRGWCRENHQQRCSSMPLTERNVSYCFSHFLPWTPQLFHLRQTPELIQSASACKQNQPERATMWHPREHRGYISLRNVNSATQRYLPLQLQQSSQLSATVFCQVGCAAAAISAIFGRANCRRHLNRDSLLMSILRRVATASTQLSTKQS